MVSYCNIIIFVCFIKIICHVLITTLYFSHPHDSHFRSLSPKLTFSSADNIRLADDVTAAAVALIGRETAAHNNK
jgi:hypothetical protein